MERDQKALVRAVVRQVHPDLFTAHPFERSKNAESLKALNIYADQLSKGIRPDPARLEFYVRRGDGTFSAIAATLPGTASLSPLFYAFGLISEEEVLQDAAITSTVSHTNDGRNLYQWLSEVAAEAAFAADQHDAIKREVRILRTAIEDKYGIASLDIGGEYALAGEAQRQQRDALTAFEQGMRLLESDGTVGVFKNLSVRLYHPDVTPLVTVGFQGNDGAFNVRTQPMESHISETGTLHIVAYDDPFQIASAVKKLDLDRAQLLCKVSSFWVRRSRELTTALQSMLGVENVWFDTRTDYGARKFVLWVGAVLERRDDITASLAGRKFAFSILVHSDESSPLLDFVGSSSVLQVRTDCPPKHLLAFMASEAADLAHETAALVADTRAEEASALEAVRNALGAKHVVRVCSSYDQAKVLDAAARLVEAAPTIRAAIDLSSISLAIDDCYDVWDSGFISIPYDFSLSDLGPQLRALLAPSSSSSSSDSSSNNHNKNINARRAGGPIGQTVGAGSVRNGATTTAQAFKCSSKISKSSVFYNETNLSFNQRRAFFLRPLLSRDRTTTTIMTNVSLHRHQQRSLRAFKLF